MKICFVGPAGSAHIRKWCAWFLGKGHEIHVISFTPGEIPGAKVHLVDLGVDPDGSDLGKLKYLTAGGKIRKMIREIRPDVVHAHYATSYGVAMALSGVKGYALSVWGSDIYDFPRRSALHKSLLQFSLKKAGTLFSTSQAMAEEAGKYTDRPFAITPFGVDMNLFSPEKRNRTDGTFVIGVVKSLMPIYGIDILLRAAAMLVKEHPEMNLRVKIAGDGPQKAELKALAGELGIAEITEFMGRISQEECANVYANLDAAVIPSVRYESFGVAAVEAQACGTPVIVSDVGGLMETAGDAGIVVPRQNPEAVAEAVWKLYKDPELRRKMGEAGRKHVLENYELNQCFGKIEKLLEEIPQGDGSSGGFSPDGDRRNRPHGPRCIFYLPYRLDEHGAGARMMRPRKMAQAFRDIGYEVTMISGTSAERRGQIRDVKKRITAGEKFEFLYMESHTEPTLLTDPSHLPTHPFLDYGFLRFVKKHGIPEGLFYSDLFWKYEGYGAGLPGWKKKSALECYRYDIRQYEKLLDRFYVPDVKTFSEVIGSGKLSGIMAELSPGAENLTVPEKKEITGPLTVFYVGGLGGNYQIAEMIKAVHDTENVRLILCCRKTEWEREKPGFAEYLCDRIEVIHKSGDELAPYYDEADLGSLLFQRGSYIDMAKPFKAYEYLGHELPVMSTYGTAIGAFVEKNDIGWNIACSAKAIQRVFREIFEDPALLPRKRRNCRAAKAENLWTCRAQQVVKDLAK